MHHNARQTQFFMSAEGVCPYLSDEYERKLFTALDGQKAQETQNALSKMGFRRSQNIIYRPVCKNCGACLSVRISASAFKPSRNHKRVLKRNGDIVREVRSAEASEEQYELFSRYVRERHMDGGMSDMSIFDYAAMVEETSVATRIIEYRRLENGRPGELVGAALSDILDDGLSMVYSFFEPDMDKRSLGSFMILDHLSLIKGSALDYLYLGYWVKNSPNMQYKARFKPIEVYLHGSWVAPEELGSIEAEIPNSQRILMQAYQTLLPNAEKTRASNRKA